MDGLLLDTERLCLETFMVVGADFGLEDPRAIYLSCIGLRGAESNAIVERHLNGTTIEVFNAHWGERIQAAFARGIPVKEGVHDLLDTLAAADVPCGVATSTGTARARQHLEDVGLIGAFEFVIGGDQVTEGKPAPEVYLRAAAALDLDPAVCAAFEDSDRGTLAAVRSGARTVQVPDLTVPSDETRALGHVIAPTLLEGARRIGLI